MTKVLRKIILVSHTHWDREWYLPFEEFRWRLVETIDQLLDLMEHNPGYRNFLLDGQTILLDDYLEVRPENQDRIKTLVKAGRLHVGPWYVLADEFLVSGESLIRNLLYGHQKAKSIGKVMAIGYTPDTFGHIAQLPQILQGFDIGTSVFWRGLEDGGQTLPTEFRWHAPDGSEVLVVHLGMGYWAAAKLSETVDEALVHLLSPLSLLAPRATSSAILLPNGSDHLPPQPHIPSLIRALNQRLVTPDILAGRKLGQLFTRFLATMLDQDPSSLQQMGQSLEPFLNQFFGPTVSAIKGAEIYHGTLQDYIEIIRKEVDIKKLPAITGEQHSGKFTPVLPGVFSARMYLKQANFASQLLLERWVEPLATIAWWLGAPYPSQWLRRAWQFLLQNHPHDSICGCSIDSVHRDMERRFIWSQQLGNRILAEALAYLNNHIDTQPPSSIPGPCYTMIRVYNPHTWPRTDIIRVKVQLDTEIQSESEYALYDATGKQVPSQNTLGTNIHSTLQPLIEQHELPCKTSGELPPHDPAQTLLLTFIAKDIPPLGYQTYYLAPQASTEMPASSHLLKSDPNSSSPTIENADFQVSISISDGTLSIHHKPSNQQYQHLLTLEDSGDIGDEYNFCPPKKNQRLTSQDAQSVALRLIENGPIVVTWEITTILSIPIQAHSSRLKRATKTARVPVRSLITLYADIPRIDVLTTLTNTASDHRLRVLFPTNIKTTSAWADTPFHVTERPIIPLEPTWDDPLFPTIMDMVYTQALNSPNLPDKPLGWFEDPSATHAQQTFVDVNDGKTGLLIASRGLPEYEILNSKNPTIALTLLRAVGWLSRADLTTRRGNAGPSLPTPEAQCHGTHNYFYSIIPHTNTWREPGAINQAHAFSVPLRSQTLYSKQRGNLPSIHSFLSIKPHNLLISTLKKAEQENIAILRFFEATGTATKVTLTAYPSLNKVESANLAETEISRPMDLSLKNAHLSFGVQPHKIMTLRLYHRNQISS